MLKVTRCIVHIQKALIFTYTHIYTVAAKKPLNFETKIFFCLVYKQNSFTHIHKHTHARTQMQAKLNICSELTLAIEASPYTHALGTMYNILMYSQRDSDTLIAHLLLFLLYCMALPSSVFSIIFCNRKKSGCSIFSWPLNFCKNTQIIAKFGSFRHDDDVGSALESSSIFAASNDLSADAIFPIDLSCWSMLTDYERYVIFFFFWIFLFPSSNTHNTVAPIFFLLYRFKFHVFTCIFMLWSKIKWISIDIFTKVFFLRFYSTHTTIGSKQMSFRLEWNKLTYNFHSIHQFMYTPYLSWVLLCCVETIPKLCTVCWFLLLPLVSFFEH